MSQSFLLCSIISFLCLSRGLTVRAKMPIRIEKLSSSSILDLERVCAIRGGEIPVHDISVSLFASFESIVWLKAWTTLAKGGILDSKITRKIIHAGSAPLFMAHWPLFSGSPYAKYIAATVPFLQVIRLYLAGTRSGKQASPSTAWNNHTEYNANELVLAVSRTGDKREALGGPLIYSLVLLVGTAFFFTDSPVAIVAISQMAAGDGMADIVGRQFGKTKWPFAPTKSLLGSAAFVLSGFAVSCALLALMNSTGVLKFDVLGKAWVIFAISVLSAAVELVPGVDDNITVPIVAAAATTLLL